MPSDGVSQLTELMQHERTYEREPVEPEEREPVDPAERRRKIRRRLIAGGIVVVLTAALAGSYVSWALNKPIGAATSTSKAPIPQVGVEPEILMPVEGGFLMSISGGEEYLPEELTSLSFGNNAVRPMASLSKLITAIVILDKFPLKDDQTGPTITFSKADHDLYDEYYVLGATIAEMKTGSTMTERHALETILIPSASNYAEAVAGWAYGSQGAFVTAANRWLDANGLTSTNMVEPTGIDRANTSTPSDMMKLARLAMKNPVVMEIVGTSALNVPGIEPMYNTNSLLGSDGINGLKTGSLKDSSNLLFSASFDVGIESPLQIVGVLMGGSSRDSINSQVIVLLDSIAAGFHQVQVAESGDEVGTYTTAWGESATMIIKSDAQLLTWGATPVEATLETSTITTGDDGEKVGTVTYTAGSETTTVDVVLKGSIEPPTDWWRLTHPFELGD